MKTEVRLAQPSEAEQFLAWMNNTPKNMFDPDIANYPSLRTMAVDVNDAPVLYVPFHPVLCVESLAHKPDIEPKENAYALRKVQNTLESLAKTYGMSEIFWMCQDESLIKFAERHGYSVIKSTVLRKKVI
jgi:hypothetical protein